MFMFRAYLSRVYKTCSVYGKSVKRASGERKNISDVRRSFGWFFCRFFYGRLFAREVDRIDRAFCSAFAAAYAFFEIYARNVVPDFDSGNRAVAHAFAAADAAGGAFTPFDRRFLMI